MKIIIDESVSYSLVKTLRQSGHTIIAIAEPDTSGLLDEEVFKIVLKEGAVFITRDYHFTNSLRFDSAKTKGIIYIRSGNLTASEEVGLVLKFFSKYQPEYFSGKLVTLYKDSIRIR